MLGKMHNHLPSSFTSTSLGGMSGLLFHLKLGILILFPGECRKAERILDSFINPDIVSIDKRIPRKVLENAKVRNSTTTT
jgi:hypothetical protein